MNLKIWIPFFVITATLVTKTASNVWAADPLYSCYGPCQDTENPICLKDFEAIVYSGNELNQDLVFVKEKNDVLWNDLMPKKPFDDGSFHYKSSVVALNVYPAHHAALLFLYNPGRMVIMKCE